MNVRQRESLLAHQICREPWMHCDQVTAVAITNYRIEVGRKPTKIRSHDRTRPYEVADIARRLLPEAYLSGASLGQFFQIRTWIKQTLGSVGLRSARSMARDDMLLDLLEVLGAVVDEDICCGGVDV